MESHFSNGFFIFYNWRNISPMGFSFFTIGEIILSAPNGKRLFASALIWNALKHGVFWPTQQNKASTSMAHCTMVWRHRHVVSPSVSSTKKLQYCKDTCVSSVSSLCQVRSCWIPRLQFHLWSWQCTDFFYSWDVQLNSERAGQNANFETG